MSYINALSRIQGTKKNNAPIKRKLTSSTCLSVGVIGAFFFTTPTFAQTTPQNPSSPGRPTPAFEVVTSGTGQNVDTSALESEIRSIAGNILLSEDERVMRIEEAVRNSTGSVGAVACAGQLDPVVATLDITGSSVSIAGGIAEAIGAIVPAAEIPGVITGLVGDGISLAGALTEQTALAFPDCEAEFTGTILGHANLATNQGISAFNGRINLGNPDGATFSPGIAIGGGAVSGAGTRRPGALASAANTTSIAIGDESQALDTFALAVGMGAEAGAIDATAIGREATARGEEAVALGLRSFSSGTRTIAIGVEAVATGDGNIAIGNETDGTSGTNTISFGNSARAAGDLSVAVGFQSSTLVNGGASSGGTAIGSLAVAGVNATAVGLTADALAEGAVAVGLGATATEQVAVAIGNSTRATETGTIAIGSTATADTQDGIAIGRSSESSGTLSIALGGDSEASGPVSTAVGGNARAIGSNSTAVGGFAEASGEGAIALGIVSRATGENSVAIGTFALANEDDTVSVGNANFQRRIVNVAAGTDATDAVNLDQLNAALNNIAVGGNPFVAINSTGGAARANGAETVAVGGNTVADGEGAVALGDSANATGAGSLALGGATNVSGDGSVALGTTANASGSNSVALGAGSTATQDDVISIGTVGSERRIINVANGAGTTDAVNIGQLNSALSNVAVGGNQFVSINSTGGPAQGTGTEAIAIGGNSTASGAGSVAIGGGSVALQDNVVSVGAVGAERRVVNVAAGVDGTDAVNVDQLTSVANIANDAIVQNLVQDGRITNLEQSFVAFGSALNQIDRRANGGIAAATALGGAFLPPDKSFGVNLNISNYRGEQGFAGSVVGKVSKNMYVTGGVAGSTVGGGTAARAGVAFGW